jgi:hypothetical protein
MSDITLISRKICDELTYITSSHLYLIHVSHVGDTTQTVGQNRTSGYTRGKLS